MFKLRNYQEQAKKDIVRFMGSQRVRGLIIQPVGVGKSIVTALIAELAEGPCLVVQPNSELLDQNVAKAKAIGLNPTIYSASKNKKQVSDLIYATPASLKDPRLFQHIHTVIIDEAHRNLSNYSAKGKPNKRGQKRLPIKSFGMLPKFLDAIKPRKVIGLTATPIKTESTKREGATLKFITKAYTSYWYNAKIIHVTQIPDILHYWSKIRYVDRSGNMDLLEKNSLGTDYTEKSMSKMFEYNDIKHKILNYVDRLLKSGRKSVLIFVPGVKEVEELVSMDNRIVGVTGSTKKKDREQIVEDFKKGKINVIANCEVFTTGFDHPELSAIIMARPTSSFTLYYQICGRAVRPLLDKDFNVIPTEKFIIDFSGNYKKFGDIRNITVEKRDYTNGYSIWCEDNLLTGFPLLVETPTREKVIDIFDKKISGYYDTYDSLKMLFGKYKGMTIKEIMEKDKGYLMWFVSPGSIESYTPYVGALKKEAEILLYQSILEK